MIPDHIKEVLRFYAEAKNYEPRRKYFTTNQGFGWDAEDSTIQKDAGEKARKILSKIGGEDVERSKV